MECLELNTLDLRYRVPPAKGEAAGREILGGVTTTFAAADVNAIMGPSGSGKSTLLEVVSMTRTVGTMAGDVLIDGMPMRGGGADAAALEAWEAANPTYGMLCRQLYDVLRDSPRGDGGEYSDESDGDDAPS